MTITPFSQATKNYQKPRKITPFRETIGKLIQQQKAQNQPKPFSMYNNQNRSSWGQPTTVLDYKKDILTPIKMNYEPVSIYDKIRNTNKKIEDLKRDIEYTGYDYGDNQKRLKDQEGYLYTYENAKVPNADTVKQIPITKQEIERLKFETANHLKKLAELEKSKQAAEEELSALQIKERQMRADQILKGIIEAKKDIDFNAIVEKGKTVNHISTVVNTATPVKKIKALVNLGTYYAYATEEERNLINYYYGIGDKEKAKEYKKILKSIAEDRGLENLQEVLTVYPNDDASIETLKRVGGAAINVVTAIPTVTYNKEVIEQNIKNLFTGRNEAVSPFSTSSTIIKTGQIGEQAATQNLSGVSKFLMSGGLSIANTATNYLLFGPAAPAMLAAQAGSQSAYNAGQRGASGSQQLLSGLTSAGAELAGESFSYKGFKNIVGSVGKTGVKNIAKQAGKQMFTEFTEEGATEVMNIASDLAIMKDKAQVAQYLEEYKKTHPNGAGTLAVLGQILYAAGQGALSGLVMSGGGTVINNFNNSSKLQLTPNLPNNMTPKLTKKSQFKIYENIDNNQKLDLNSAAYKNIISNKKTVEIPNEVLSKYQTIKNDPQQSLIQAIKDYYDKVFNGRKVDVKVNDGIIEVKFANDGKRKSVGWRMQSDKAATFEYLDKLFENSEYSYSEKNRDLTQIHRVPVFHYFITDVKINGNNYPVKLQIREVNNGSALENRYYTHNIIKDIKNGSYSPVGANAQGVNSIDSNAYASNNNIPQNMDIVKNSIRNNKTNNSIKIIENEPIIEKGKYQLAYEQMKPQENLDSNSKGGIIKENAPKSTPYQDWMKTNRKGSSEKVIMQYKPSSGVILESTPGKTTTIIGNHKNDMSKIITELGYPKSQYLGARKGWFNVLNRANKYFINREQFWNEHNVRWADAVIERQDIILLATIPKGKVMKWYNSDTKKFELSGFAKEYIHFRKNGYTYDSKTMRLLPKNYKG